VQGRVTREVRADGVTATVYTYDPATGLLSTVSPRHLRHGVGVVRGRCLTGTGWRRDVTLGSELQRFFEARAGASA
jgi:hypothetical protein